MPETSDEDPVSEVPVTKRWAHLVHLKHVATLIVAIAGLITAIGAAMKPETSARKSYDELSKGIEQISRDNERNHLELEQVRTYLWTAHVDALQEAGVTPQEARDAGALVGSETTVSFQHGSLRTAPDAGKVAKVVPKHIKRPPPASTSSAPTQAYVPPDYVDVTGTQDTSLF